MVRGMSCVNAFELVDRHQQVVRDDAADRQRVVVELETRDRRVEQIAIQVVVQLIGRRRGRARSIAARRLDALLADSRRARRWPPGE